jgi:hydrogenase large subunit
MTPGAVGAINMERLNLVKSIIDRTIEFIEQVYIPDLLAIASFYKGWLTAAACRRRRAVLRRHPGQGQRLLARQPAAAARRHHQRRLDKVHEVDLKDPEQIQEFVNHSWYKYADESKGLHPWDGVTEPNYELGQGPNFKGTRPTSSRSTRAAKYSWIKAPRWRGHAMEVGPLARYIIGYVQPKQ